MNERRYEGFSFWLETCGDDLTPRPALDGSVDVDVAILGAGYTGLWTAYQLLQREPGLRVGIVEAEIAGFGASGRNGGWCYPSIALGPAELTSRYGRDAARAVLLAMIDAVHEVDRVCTAEGIDAAIARDGALDIARASWQLPKVIGAVEEYEAAGMGDHVVLLDAAQTLARVPAAGAIAAMWKKDAIAVQPAMLARGLARAVERHGATIWERTRVLDYRGGERPVLVTDRGEVRASRAIVLAGEAYLAQLDKTRRNLIPLTSNMVITEPLPESFWAEHGWHGRELVGGSGLTGAYIQKTADGRVALGPFRTRYPFNSQITDALDLDEEVFAHARRSVATWFPMLAGARFTHAWGGVFGMPRDGMPTMGFNPRTKVAMACGYSGSGVSTATLSGQVLGDLITGRDTALTHLPMTSHKPREWEPEPLRWAGVTYVQRSHVSLQEKIDRTGRVPRRKTIAQRFYDR
jgi:glycine/D-amino acid oxidase-like deaminating enzyme